MKRRPASPSGFTLIELLVVVAIIGLLSSIIVAGLSVARSKARDVKRRSDLHQVAVALELYYNAHGNYTTESYNGACGTALDGTDLISVGLKSDGFLGLMPSVPTNSGTCGDSYYAGTWNNGANVAVLTHLENVDANCNPNFSWYESGSYCNGYYVIAE